MSMVVKNNMSAISTLNTLNQNSSALSKSLEKVSSGMKINSAADDASGYAISERMRVQIRGLDQANQNTQNAQSLLKVAEGAVSSSLDILKTMKEKAINSANDTNTDIDRATIQKELNQSIDQIDDNANVTFNGKRLLDGSSQLPVSVQEHIVNALATEWMENAMDLVSQSLGINFRDEHAAVKDITVKFGDSNTSIGSGTMGNQTLALVASSYTDTSKKADKMELWINMDFFGALDVADTSNVNGKVTGGLLDRTIAHELTHAIMASSINGFYNLDSAIVEGMAELVHGIDDERPLINASPTGGGTPNAYAGGYVGLRYMAKQGGDEQEVIKKFMNILVNEGAGALDKAVSYATGGKFSSWSDVCSKFNDDHASASAENLAKYCGILDATVGIKGKDTGAITGHDAHGSHLIKDENTVVPEGGSTKFWYSPGSKQTTIDGLTITWDTDWQAKTGNMTFQVGTKANQAIKVGFLDMTAEGLGLMDTEGKKVSVESQEQATAAIRLFDQSIAKALAQQTTIGALQSRLSYTSANLTTASENVQGSESTIRDADMAKEMTAYTKHNVLLQSAQSMLAQANQNSSAVLSLLQ